MSIPYNGKQFIFNQPDGSKLPVRGWGNQYNAVFETLDGYTVTEDPAPVFIIMKRQAITMKSYCQPASAQA